MEELQKLIDKWEQEAERINAASNKLPHDQRQWHNWTRTRLRICIHDAKELLKTGRKQQPLE